MHHDTFRWVFTKAQCHLRGHQSKPRTAELFSACTRASSFSAVLNAASCRASFPRRDGNVSISARRSWPCRNILHISDHCLCRGLSKPLGTPLGQENMLFFNALTACPRLKPNYRACQRRTAQRVAGLLTNQLHDIRVSPFFTPAAETGAGILVSQLIYNDFLYRGTESASVGTKRCGSNAAHILTNKTEGMLS